MTLISCYLLLNQEINLSKHFRMLVIIALCLSVFLRIESFILGCALMLPLVILQKPPFQKLLQLAPAAILAVLLVITLNIDWTTRDADYNAMREYQFVILDYEIELSNDYQQTNDSITLAAALAFFLNDPERINPEFLSKYLPVMDKNPLHIKDYLLKTDFSLGALQAKYNRLGFRYVLLWVLLGLFVLVLWFTKHIEVRVVLLYLYFLAVLLTIFLLMKMENRIILPAFIGFFLILYSNLKRARPVYAFTLISFSIFFFLPNTKYQELRDRYASYEKVFAKTSTLDDEAVLVFDMHGVVWYGRKLFDNYPINRKVFSLDNALLFYTPEYKAQVSKNFANKNSATIYASFINKKYYLIGDNSRAELIHNYFRQVYGIDAELHIFDRIDNYNTIFQLKSL